MTNKYRHAELDSASTLYIGMRFRNKFGMTLGFILIRHPHKSQREFAYKYAYKYAYKFSYESGSL